MAGISRQDFNRLIKEDDISGILPTEDTLFAKLFPDEMETMKFLAFMARSLYGELEETRQKLDQIISSQITNLDPDQGK